MDNAIVATRQPESYLVAFTDFEKRAIGREQAWLRKLRDEAFERFCEVGFPGTREEDWRFTDVSAIAQTVFRLPHSGAAQLSPEEIEQYRLTGAGCHLVFVNGRFTQVLSSPMPSKGISVGSLAEAISRNSGEIEAHLGRYLNIQRDAFCALNTAFLEGGAYVHLRRGAVVDAPIYLLFISTASGTPVMTHPRNLIVAEDKSQATVVEDYVSLGGGAAFTNTVTELVAGEDSVLSHYVIKRENSQAYNVSTLCIQQGRRANITSHSLLLGGALVRNNVHSVFAGEGGDCLINGLFIGNGSQHMDNYMLVEHASPHCSSRQFYSGILDGQARGIFHGRIVVHKDAQKTDARQTNRNLLLSDGAQIDTKPQLEIYADDVKCTHGATIGQIGEDALFYLRSRGIDEAEARRLLLLAFASESMDRMKPDAVRTHAQGLVNEYLSQGERFARQPAEREGLTDDSRRNSENVT